VYFQELYLDPASDTACSEADSSAAVLLIFGSAIYSELLVNLLMLFLVDALRDNH